jgi:hypothetical protein
MKKISYNLLFLISPFAFLIATVNIVVDPAKIFSNNNYEKKVADILLKGHNIDNLRNFNQRITLKNIVTNLPNKLDVIAIGSSRLFEMSSDIFPNKKFLNCSLAHGNTKDFVAVIGLLDSCNKLPNEVYIDTSPMITIIDEADSDEWESIFEYYFYGLDKIKIAYEENEKLKLPINLFKKKITNIFSFSYFQKSFFAIPKMEQNKFLDVGKEIPKNFGRMSDFSIVYPSNKFNSDTLKATSDALFFVKNKTTPTVNYIGLEKLKKMIAFFDEKKIKVTLVNLPFQIDFYNQFEAKNSVFSDLDKELNKIAFQYNIRVLGSFNPKEADINRSQFFDYSHSNKEALISSLRITKNQPK